VLLLCFSSGFGNSIYLLNLFVLLQICIIIVMK